jgi:hypothetical protein
MALFTVEVSGRPIVVFSEEDRSAAEETAALVIGPDLQGFNEAGQPLWDGTTELLVREASPGEAARWEQGFADAQDSASGESDPEDYAVFLIDVEEEGGQ